MHGRCTSRFPGQHSFINSLVDTKDGRDKLYQTTKAIAKTRSAIELRNIIHDMGIKLFYAYMIALEMEYEYRTKKQSTLCFAKLDKGHDFYYNLLKTVRQITLKAIGLDFGRGFSDIAKEATMFKEMDKIFKFVYPNK